LRIDGGLRCTVEDAAHYPPSQTPVEAASHVV
jgi:hypothetical protein